MRLLLALSALVLTAQEPAWVGDPDEIARLQPHLEAALTATEAFGPLPRTAWRVQLHPDAASFEKATGAPPQRAAAWVGSTLHLRPWEQLRRREVGSLLRHEVAHRRLLQAGLQRWEEEARCLWAEGHVHPPERWPTTPREEAQAWLDRALARGRTETQALAYRWLRAWLERRPLPTLPEPEAPKDEGWRDLPPEGTASPGAVRVTWPPERLPSRLVVNGRELSRRTHTFSGPVSFGPDTPVARLEGRVEAHWTRAGWSLTWWVEPDTWVAAALAGELGEAPFEARRALAAVLRRWLAGHPAGHHADGSLCPLTHCAVVRGLPDAETLRAAREAPPLPLDPRWAFFHGSSGGSLLSPREAWGRGPETKGRAEAVPGDRWAAWERTFTPAQVQHLKRDVKPGLRPGQLGLRIGPSGPYAVEALRLAAGRRFGWTAWPSNASEATLQPDGTLRVRGRGWGHNVGLCLASAVHWAKQGWSAERILETAFGALLEGNSDVVTGLGPVSTWGARGIRRMRRIRGREATGRSPSFMSVLDHLPEVVDPAGAALDQEAAALGPVIPDRRPLHDQLLGPQVQVGWHAQRALARHELIPELQVPRHVNSAGATPQLQAAALAAVVEDLGAQHGDPPVPHVEVAPVVDAAREVPQLAHLGIVRLAGPGVDEEDGAQGREGADAEALAVDAGHGISLRRDGPADLRQPKRSPQIPADPRHPPHMLRATPLPTFVRLDG